MTLGVADVMSDYPGLTRAPAAFVARLNQSNGRIVEYWDLQQAVEAVTGVPNTIENLRTTVKRARAALAGKAIINSAYGIGYSIKWLDK